MKKTIEDLSTHLRNRALELRKLKETGVKIVGYFPGGFVPEELVSSCGAVPVGLVRGGDHDAVQATLSYACRFIDAFAKTQLGHRLLGEDPFYQMIDLYVVPIVDRNTGAIASYWEFYTDAKVFKFGVPHLRTDYAFKYYLDGIKLLKDRLEKLTGIKITDEKLKEQINLYNRMRVLFRKISYIRKKERPPISGKEFVKLNHDSYYADLSLFVEVLESLLEELKKKEGPVKSPRVMLTGSTLAMGDSRVVDLIEASGGAIVIEEFAEGVRPYNHKVLADGDLMNALADMYFGRRTPGAFARPATRERFDYLIELAKEFNVDGIIWYNMTYRDSYNTEGFYFEKLLRDEVGMPVLKIESEYDPVEVGPLRTRIETFLETLKTRKGA